MALRVAPLMVLLLWGIDNSASDQAHQNDGNLANLLQELRTLTFLSQDALYMLGKEKQGEQEYPQLSHLSHLATIAQGVQYMSASVENLSQVLSTQLVPRLSHSKDVPTLKDVREPRRVDYILKDSVEESREQIVHDSRKRSEHHSELEFLQATNDMLKLELKEKETEGRHLILNMSLLERDYQALGDRNQLLLQEEAREMNAIQRPGVMDTVALRVKLEEELTEALRERDEHAQHKKKLEEQGERLAIRGREIGEEVSRLQQRERAIIAERNAITESTKLAMQDKVIAEQEMAGFEAVKRNMEELTRAAARRVYELEVTCSKKRGAY